MKSAERAISQHQQWLEAELLPAANLFFSDDLWPEEKRTLIESGLVDDTLIKNRLENQEISEDERQVLEDFV